jgi:hypothetical protein
MKTAFERMKPELRLKYDNLNDVTKEDCCFILKKYLFEITILDGLLMHCWLSIDLNNFLDNFEL